MLLQMTILLLTATPVPAMTPLPGPVSNLPVVRQPSETLRSLESEVELLRSSAKHARGESRVRLNEKLARLSRLRDEARAEVETLATPEANVSTQARRVEAALRALEVELHRQATPEP